MVDGKEVQRVAENARINVDEEDVGELSDKLEEILEKFESLQEVDTEEVEPSFHPVEIADDSRDDDVEESLDRGEVFGNTDNVEKDKFRGPNA